MNLLAIVHMYVGRAGHNAGAEWMLHAILREWAALGDACTVVVRDYRGRPYEIDGVRVEGLPSLAALVKRAADADWVVTHLDLTQTAERVAVRARRPILHLVHNDSQLRLHGVEPRARQLVAYNSLWLQRTVPWPGRSVVCRPHVSVRDYETTPGECVTLVNLIREKGLRTFVGLALALPGTRFLGVRGAYGRQDTRVAGQLRNVEIVANRPNVRDAVYARTRVLLMPSHYESWGRTAIEAACSGIPTLARPTPGLRESLGHAGTFVPGRGIREWAAALRRFEDADYYAQRSATARARALELENITRADTLALRERLADDAAATGRSPKRSTRGDAVSLHSFVIAWPGFRAQAARIEKGIGRDVTVLNSDPTAHERRWVLQPREAFYSARWNKVLELCRSDVIGIVCADVESASWRTLMARAREAFLRLPQLGVYAPNVDTHYWAADAAELRRVAGDVYETPATNGMCWFVRASVAHAVGPVDTSVNALGWGIDFVVGATARWMGYVVGLDAGITVKHPEGTSYDCAEASSQMHAYLKSCSPAVRGEVRRLMDRAELLRASYRRRRTIDERPAGSMAEHGWRHGVDKVIQHGYERFYEPHLQAYRERDMTLLEIGVDAGRSIDMWLDMFPRGRIYGMDVAKAYEYPRGRVFKGNQRSRKDLDRVASHLGHVDVIVDDGSHKPEHQLYTFNYAFDRLLAFDGLYVVEDVETSYWRRGTVYGNRVRMGYDRPGNLVRIFRDVADVVNREFLTEENEATLGAASKISAKNLRLISSITFGANCIIVKKMSQSEAQTYGTREYRFRELL